MSLDETYIATLLSQSRAAHSAYQFAKSQRKPAEAREQLELAADKRREAHESDPEHAAPAWNDDAIQGDHATATHAEMHDRLVQFYASQLAK